MPERSGSSDSFDGFFGGSKPDNDIPTSSTVAALIKTQPVVHHRQTPSERKTNINSKKVPLTTNVKNTSTKSKLIDSPQSKIYQSDFDDDEKQNRSLPPPKQRSIEISRRVSDSKLKASYINKRKKERFLPYIRSQKLRKRQPKKEIKRNEMERRILSAQNDKFNELQSRLAELRRQLEEERIENRTLRVIKKREEKALKKYEDQEYDVHKIATDYIYEIEHIKEKIINEREIKIELEKEINDRDDILYNQTKRIKFYEKLVFEKNLDESDQLREKLKENNNKLKKYQEKIENKKKYIENLEKTYRHEIHQELLKQRDLKHEIENHSKRYTDLLIKFEEKTRQVDTMHIYIQRGGRRPSNSSTITKSYSFQSLQDTSPRFREKIMEYDKKRRKEQELKPKPKPKPLPTNPPPKPERIKYVPNIIPKPRKVKSLSISSHVIHDEKPPPPTIKNEHLIPKEKPPVRHLSTPKSIDESESDREDEIPIESTIQKPPSPLTRTIQRSEKHLSHASVHQRLFTPISPPIQSKSNLFEIDKNTTTSSLFKHTEPPLPAKPPITHKFDDKWTDIFDTNKKEESTKNDLISKLISDEKQEKKHITTTQPLPSSSQHSSMIMFEPSSLATNGNLKKPLARMTPTNIYDFEQTIINLHEGKPAITQPTTTKTSVDPFESLFDNNTPKSAHRINGRDDTFTTTIDKSDPFESFFDQPTSAANTATTIQPTTRQFPLQNDKLQRPKVVTNTPKPIPNRTVVEEIEEFVL